MAMEKNHILESPQSPDTPQMDAHKDARRYAVDGQNRRPSREMKRGQDNEFIGQITDQLKDTRIMEGSEEVIQTDGTSKVLCREDRARICR